MDQDPTGCSSFQAAMDVLAKPWTGHVILALHAGPLRFGELREAVGSIGDRMLSVRLRELEQKSLVKRHVIEGPPVRVEYELTVTGRGFRDVSDAVRKWGGAILVARERANEASAKTAVASPKKRPKARAKAS